MKNKLKLNLKSIINYPTPVNISFLWNYGSLMGVMLLTQIFSGLLLTMHYSPNTKIAFNSIIHIRQNVNYGWLIQYIHMNGASFYFICIFIHIYRNIYYNSFNLWKVWVTGVIILLMSMTTAFMGYVLPWGQMSFWGATVITNLISSIPYIGMNTTYWLWGGFSVSNPTLNRFYTFHFFLPMIIFLLVLFHLIFLHEKGSNNPLGSNNINNIPFHLYFTLKDSLTFMILMYMLIILSMLNPFLFSDPENFSIANSMNTPIHIQPEWYFLFAYSILRSIPNKLGGVLAMMLSILILLILPIYNLNKYQSSTFYPFNKLLFWMFLNLCILLTWMGMKPVEIPFIFLNKMFTLMYFFYFLINPLINKLYEILMNNKLYFMKSILNKIFTQKKNYVNIFS
uniref:Cytochrome b n=1 Tax=Helorus sp. ZJUH_2016017 TaxID=2491159 RepID=A0A3S8V0V7_9HYME|nr:cytochrome b [Helorus sp. ZJUH_2016017]